MGEIDRCIDQLFWLIFWPPMLYWFLHWFMGQSPFCFLYYPLLEVESYMFKDAKKDAQVLSRNAMLRLVLERRTMEELQNDRCSDKHSESFRAVAVQTYMAWTVRENYTVSVVFPGIRKVQCIFEGKSESVWHLMEAVGIIRIDSTLCCASPDQTGPLVIFGV